MGDSAKKSGKDKPKKKKAAEDSSAKPAEAAPAKEEPQPVAPESESAPAPKPEQPAVQEPTTEDKPPPPQREEDKDEWSKVAEEYTAHMNVKRPEPKRGHQLDSLDETKLIELKETFKFFDVNKDGIIDFSDLRSTFDAVGQASFSDDDIKAMLSEASSPLDFEAFAVLLGCRTLDLDPEDILIHAFSMWDRKKTGLISEARLRFDLASFEDKFTEDEVDIALEEAPIFMKNDKPMIDYNQFARHLGGMRSNPKK